MSYQIKSTPFFQRMLSTSKKNGQLQKLKEEYEKMNNFNERTIELKMRTLRLKRLFREIEILRENDMKKQRLNEEIKQRGLLDKEYNSPPVQSTRTRASSSDYSSGRRAQRTSATTSRSRTSRYEYNQYQRSYNDDDLSRARLLRRIDYGNQISSWNLNRMGASKLTKEVNKIVGRASATAKSKRQRGEADSASNITKKRQKLINRLNYGNSKSNLNLHKAVNMVRTIESAEDETMEHITTSSATLRPDDEDAVVRTDVDATNSEFLNAENATNDANNDNSEMYSCLSRKASESQSSSGKPLWDLVRTLSHPRSTSSKAIDLLDECTNELDFQLRNISNDTDLSNLQVMGRRPQFSLSDNNLIENEILERIETYEPPNYEDSPAALDYKISSNNFQEYETEQCSDAANAAKQTKLPMDEQMEIIAKFMPFMVDTVKNETSTFCVKTLRKIFEEKDDS